MQLPESESQSTVDDDAEESSSSYSTRRFSFRFSRLGLGNKDSKLLKFAESLDVMGFFEGFNGIVFLLVFTQATMGFT